MRFRLNRTTLTAPFVTAFLALAVGLLATSSARAETYVVSPSGGDDTAALQSALDSAIADGGGSTVLLTEGTFYTNQLVAFDLRGDVRGAGKDATIVEALPDLPGVEEPFFADPGPDNPWPFLFLFLGGNFSLSDMTIQVPSTPATETWTIFGTPFDQLWGIVGIAGDCEASSIDRCRITGTIHEDAVGIGNYNSLQGVFWIGFYPLFAPVKGEHSLTRSEVGYAAAATYAWNARDAKFVVGGSAAEGNDFFETQLNLVDDVSDSSYEFSYNRTEPSSVPEPDGPGVPVSQLTVRMGLLAFIYGAAPLDLKIEHNTFRTGAGYDNGIELVDLGPGQALGSLLNATVRSNRLDVSGLGADAILASDVTGADISNNRIDGSGVSGIHLAGATDASMVRGNNLEHFAPGMASIWLGLDTSGNTVIGGNPQAVLDEGTDNQVGGNGGTP